VRVIWTPESLQDRADVWDYIAADNPRAAARMDELFSDAAASNLSDLSLRNARIDNPDSNLHTF